MRIDFDDVPKGIFAIAQPVVIVVESMRQTFDLWRPPDDAMRLANPSMFGSVTQIWKKPLFQYSKERSRRS
jgi:hypothetical protein